MHQRSVAERAGPAPSEALREEDLARLWENGRLPKTALVTLDGTPLQVVYRGRRNRGPGPDFRDAIIALPDARLLQGDVELHLRASDFRRHGHQRDPAYNRVVMHLVRYADDGSDTGLQSGRRVPIVALERWLQARANELRTMLAQPALWREPCQSAVERMGADTVGATLARLGERRLQAKAASLAGRPAVLALYQELLRTLGHGPQRDAWLHLAGHVPPPLLEQASERPQESRAPAVEALLLGAAGLLPNVSDPYSAELHRLWRAHGSPSGLTITTAGPHRPANHPARRLAGLARLLQFGIPPLLDRLRAAVLSEARPEQALLRSLTVPADGLWAERTLPWGSSRLSGPAPALIGAGKAIELAINAALPVLLATAERNRDTRLAGAVRVAFHGLPAPAPYGSTAHLNRALQLDGVPLLRRADHSQGALYLFANYCTQGGCGRCPLS